MCGIAGYTGPRQPGKLKRMLSSMVHRGPDGEGIFENGPFHLGMRRLAILDLETGDQPKFSSNKNAVVFLNGEIYNWLELRRDLERQGIKFSSRGSDTEVIAQLYQTHGLSFTDKLIGMYAICLLDRKKSALYLFRDRLGKKQIYYRRDETGRLEFASEYNALKAHLPTPSPDSQSLIWYFSQKTMPASSSIDTRIKKIPAGARLIWRPGKDAVVQPYYSLTPARVKSTSGLTRLIGETEALLRDSVRLRMRADVEVGAFLSGGLDSSLIVALASQYTSKPLKTYCLVYEDPVNHKAEDRFWSRKIAKRYATDHREVMLTPGKLMRQLPLIAAAYGQPNAAVLSTWFVAGEMKKRIKVALSGDGADELFGSYLLHRVSRRLPNLPLAQVLDRFAVFTDQEQRALLRPGLYPEGRSVLMLDRRVKQLRSNDALDRVLEFDCRNLLAEQVLNYSDMLGMAQSIEIRNPFLDHRLVEKLFSIPSRYKIRNEQTKYLLKKIAERYLPKGLIYRPKEGFVEPSVYWIHGPMRKFCRSYLEDRRFNRLGLLNPAFVRRLAERFWRDYDYRTAKQMWTIFMYALWEKHGLDG